MQNRQIGKIIAVTENTVTILLESGKSEQVFKSLFNFTVTIGDEVFLYLDDSGRIVYIELRSSLGQTSSSEVRVTHSYSPQSYRDEGSFWGGFFLTLLFPVIGLVIALVMDKAETRRGALRAVVVQVVFAVLIFLIAMMGVCSAGY